MSFYFRHISCLFKKLNVKRVTISNSTSNFSFNKLFSSSNRLTSFFNFSFSLKVPPTLPDSKTKFIKF